MHAQTSEQLHEQAVALGVATGFWDGTGHWHQVSDATLRAVLLALNDRAGTTSPWPPVLVTYSGRPCRWEPPDDEPVYVVLESGEHRAPPIVLPGDLPVGYHQLVGASGATSLVVAPQCCYLPAFLTARGRAWGWAVQAYAVRSSTSWGIGDLGDLGTFMCDDALRSDFVLINPLNAPDTPADPSPYCPSTRLFRNPIYLDVEQVPERSALTGRPGARFQELVMAGRHLTDRSLIDREAVFQVKDEALRLCYSALGQLHGRRREFDTWRAATPMAESFAVFRALQGTHGDDWHCWPTGYQRPDSTAVDAFRAQHADEVGYQAWLQWLLEAQLTAIPRTRIGIVNDFAVGVAVSGFDAWVFQDQIASGLTIGAPPDAFAPGGQNWRLSAFAPNRLTASGYHPFIKSIQAAMTGAGGLRIDHVMGLFRLFLIPDGAEPAQGTYLQYPAEDLLGIIALESQRAHVLVIGEDLGNVEPGVRDRLAAGNMLSSRLVWFERDPVDGALPRRAVDYPRLAMAAVATHDLPTIAGVLSDSDLRHQRDLGLIAPERFQAALEANQQFKEELLGLLQREGLLAEDSRDVGSVSAALHAFLAHSPAMLVAARLEDALEMRNRPNVPGTGRQLRPQNWSLPLPVLLEAMHDDPRAQHLAELLRALITTSA
jgi:4-alpha-glucanotransferase